VHRATETFSAHPATILWTAFTESYDRWRENSKCSNIHHHHGSHHCVSVWTWDEFEEERWVKL
jgi:hypothetical protein